jgi:hypothetical protein
MGSVHSSRSGAESANPLESFRLNIRQSFLWETMGINCGFFVICFGFYSQLFCEDLVFIMDLFGAARDRSNGT